MASVRRIIHAHPKRVAGSLPFLIAWATAMLAIGDGEGHLRIWNRSILSEPTKAHDQAIWSLAWSQDGRLACGSWDRSISIWKIDFAAQNVIPSLLGTIRQAHNQRVRDLAWIDGDRTIASAGDDGMLKFWESSDLRDRGFFEQSPKPEIWRLAYRKDKKEIATANNDGSVRIYQFYPARQEAHGDHLDEVICLTLTESKVLSFDIDGLLNIFNSFSRTEEKPVQIPVGFQSGIRCARFQPKIKCIRHRLRAPFTHAERRATSCLGSSSTLSAQNVPSAGQCLLHRLPPERADCCVPYKNWNLGCQNTAGGK
jgi:WD40 repeat protein